MSVVEKLFAIWVGLASVGCITTANAQLRLPAIDPSGQRILLPAPNYTTLTTNVDAETGRKTHPLMDHLLHRNPTQAQGGSQGRFGHGSVPAFTNPATPPDCPEGIMPNTPYGEQVQTIPFGPVAPRVIVPGRHQDPETAAQDSTKGCLRHKLHPSHPQSVVSLSPKRQVAPVGSEVVLIGGICDGTGYYQMRAPAEWAISQGSVGHFVDPGRAQVGRSPLRGHLGDFFAEPLPELLSNNYAIGQTSRKLQVLTRGTPDPSDDLMVESGQTWIGLTSPQEGTTYVTFMAPYLDGWEQRTETAIIHWIDGQWTFPRPAIVQGIQPHTMTTSVRRKVTEGGITGWTVRYEILDATATFDGKGGSTVREVRTDSKGEAKIKILPAIATGGSTQVKVQVIRPPQKGERDPLVLGEGTTRVTWTTSQVAVRISGPESVELNDSPTYQITISNPGTLASDNVYVRAMIPVGFQVTGVSPIGQQVGSRVDWTIAQLRPGEEQVFEISYRVTQSGTARHCVNVQATGGSPIEDCLTTEVTMDALHINMVGPNPEIPLQVGQNVDYKITITNRGDRALTDVRVMDRFDAGLAHQIGAGPIDWPLGRLEPGQSREMGLSFRIVKEGRHCHSIEATATGTPPARTGACVTGRPEPRRDMAVRKTAPTAMAEGERADFYVEVENTGEAPLTNLTITDRYGSEFRIILANPPESSSERNTIVWYITRLAPGEKRTFQVTCQAMFGNVERACSDVVVRSADGVQRTDNKCLPIRSAAGGGRSPTPGGYESPGSNSSPIRGNTPLPDTAPAPGALPFSSSSLPPNGPVAGISGGLEMTMTTQGNRWRVGDQIDYLVTIRNNRSTVDNGVVLSIQLPPQLQLRNYNGPVSAGEHSGDWRKFSMVPIQTLRPGETVRFTISVVVAQAGQVLARAQVRSVRSPAGVSREDVSLAST